MRPQIFLTLIANLFLGKATSFPFLKSRVNEKALRPLVNSTNNLILVNSTNYWDWREMGMVSPIKDQRRCAACWAFSIVANIESHLAIYLNQREVLSEQFLLDCDMSIKNVCSNGSLLQTFGNIVTKFGGIPRECDYKGYFEGRKECEFTNETSIVPVVGFTRVKSDERIMAEYVYKYGPLSAGINSNSMKKIGLNQPFVDEPTDEECSSDPDQMDHAVLIVGYSVYVNNYGEQIPYWIIKNSWSSNWGDQGFYYLVRGRNACGIANDVSYAFVN